MTGWPILATKWLFGLPKSFVARKMARGITIPVLAQLNWAIQWSGYEWCEMTRFSVSGQSTTQWPVVKRFRQEHPITELSSHPYQSTWQRQNNKYYLWPLVEVYIHTGDNTKRQHTKPECFEELSIRNTNLGLLVLDRFLKRKYQIKYYIK